MRNYTLVGMRVLALIISFVIGIIITRALTVHDRGVYTFFTSWSAIGMVVISGGAPVFLLKRLVDKSIKNLLSSVLLLCASFAAVFLIIVAFTQSDMVLVACVVWVSFLMSLVSISRHHLISKGNLLLNELYLMLPNTTMLMVYLAGYFLWPQIVSKVYFWIFSSAIIYTSFVLYIYNQKKERFKWIITRKIFWTLLLKVVPFYLVALLGIFQSKIPYVLLSIKSDYKNLAMFGVAEIIPALFVSVTSALISKSAFLIFSKNNNLFKKLSSIALQILVMYILGLTACFFLGELLITAIYGKEYVVSSKLVPVLLTVAFFSIINDLLFNLLIERNKTIYGVVPAIVWLVVVASVYLLKLNVGLSLLAGLQLGVTFLMFCFFGITIFRINRRSYGFKA